MFFLICACDRQNERDKVGVQSEIEKVIMIRGAERETDI
jgi:hypothetical protein